MGITWLGASPPSVEIDLPQVVQPGQEPYSLDRGVLQLDAPTSELERLVKELRQIDEGSADVYIHYADTRGKQYQIIATRVHTVKPISPD